LYKNYHTHTYRCKHAQGDVNDYAKVAIDNKVAVLGFSDHTPLPDNRWTDVRMELQELGGYISAIESTQIDFPQLTILKGMECEFADEYAGFYKDELLGRLKFDYIIAGAHYYPLNGDWVSSYNGSMEKYQLKAYAEYVVRAINSGLFAFIAHPDLFGSAYEQWDRNAASCSRYILEAAQDMKVPLEINGYGLRKPKRTTPEGMRSMYPWMQFWELAAEYDIRVVMNSDAHKPSDVTANIDEACSIARRYGLKAADLSYLEKGRKA